MPQMNPIYWVTLFFMFIMVFMVTNSINYFFPTKLNISFTKKNNIYKNTNWKW